MSTSGSFGNQANALLRKSITYQKRNISTNCCLLTAPIFFSLLLLIIQTLINNLFLSGPDFSCGCQCTKCCGYNNDPNNCKPLESGVCNSQNGLSCQQTNASNCGFQFSSGAQAAFCSISNPSNWPAFIDTPNVTFRASPPRPSAEVLVTAATPQRAGAFGQYLFTPLTTLGVIEALPLLINNFTRTAPGGATYENGYVLSEMGLQFGSSVTPDSTYYIPTTFLSTNNTYVLLPSGTCEAFGISQTHPIGLLELVGTLTNTNSLLSTSSFNTGFNISGNYSISFGSISVLCTDTDVQVLQNASAINNLLFCGYEQSRCNGTSFIQEYSAAWDFGSSSASSLSLNAWYNQTSTTAGGGGPGTTFRLPGLLNLGVKAWWMESVSNASSVPSVELLGLMSMPIPANKLSLDFSSLLGPLFYTWVVQLLFPTFLQQLVYEKEKRLRMMMKMHGLGDPAYWLITYCWYIFLYILYIIVFLIFGTIFNLQYFRRTNYGIQIIFYFLNGQCMIAFAFMLSSLFRSSLTAVVFAYLYVFASGLIGSLLLQTFMNQNPLWIFFVEWVPAWSLFRGLYEIGSYTFLGVYTNSQGMEFSNLHDANNGMLSVWGIFLVEWVIFMVLGWYFEQVISSGNGIKRHPLFFLDCFRRQKGSSGLNKNSLHANRTSLDGEMALTVKPAGELADVQAERDRVERMTDFSNTPILVRNIKKIYPGQDGGKPKVAVKSLTLGIERGECFGLLGPNGAGKTTSINVLTGFLEPSGGSAMIEGYNLSEDMQEVYKLMGVCPQHDLLWEQLTGEEHLLFYGRLKGFNKQQLEESVTAGLQSVNLLNVRDKQAGKYSGGMKRRLSVAISFVGSPKVVYLDEPSTGLDPASRRGLWEVVKANKSGKALILTTHSMEEAEMLCDRLGIFVDGQLVCIGNPKEITHRYAGYLVFTITVPPNEDQAARKHVLQMSPNAILTYELGGTLKYELPCSEITLSGVFEAMSLLKQKITVLDWGVANATLEEVFIKFARQSGIKSEES